MTEAEFHRRAMELFDLACDLPSDERKSMLDQACTGNTELRAKVERMLAQDAVTGVADLGDSGGAADQLAVALSSSTPDMHGTPDRIGAYRILRRIGQGGMGIIYEAEQESPRRRVALKVLQAGVINRAMLRRFQQEAQVLGQLQHPGIAQVYEAGLADLPHGRQPFFAMEFIDGQPLDRHAESQQLSPRQKLELLARVCDAVQHAHQKGVIHRDLKPANVLVAAQQTEAHAGTSSALTIDRIGLPKVLDFGIARMTDADVHSATVQTEVGQIVGTLAYMSPEQVRGDSAVLDTRCDVYALGVMLYQLLAGRRPYDLTGMPVPEAARRVQELEPPRLGAIVPALRGDVETIVAKALEKDRERRYGSASELAADIRRYRAAQPIQARPATTMYLMQRFARRNRALVGGLAATFLMLVVALIATAYGLVQADQRRMAAIATNERLQKVVNYQSEMLTSIDAAEMGQRMVAHLREEARSVIREDAADQLAVFDSVLSRVSSTTLASRALDESIMTPAVAALDSEFVGEPLLRADLRRSVVGIYDRIGLFEKSLEQARLELDTRAEALGPEHFDTLAARHRVCALLEETGAYEDAEAEARALLVIERRVLGDEHLETLSTQRLLGDVLSANTRYDEAIQFLQAAFETLVRTVGDSHPRTLEARQSLAEHYFRQRQLDKALENYEAVLREQERSLGSSDPATLVSLGQIANVYFMKNDFEQARVLQQRLADTLAASRGVDHPSTLTAKYQLANTLTHLKDYAAAEVIVEDTLARSRRVLGPDHPTTINALGAGLRLGIYSKHWDRAESYGNEALEAAQRTLGPDNAETLDALADLVLVYHKSERHEQAIPAARQALAEFRRVFGAEHARTATMQQEMAKVLMSAGRLDEAAEILDELLDICRRDFRDKSVFAGTLGIAVTTMIGVDRAADAESLAIELLAWCESHGAGEGTIGRCYLWIARAQFAQGKLDDADRSLREAHDHTVGAGMENSWQASLTNVYREVVAHRRGVEGSAAKVAAAYESLRTHASEMFPEDRNTILPEVVRLLQEPGKEAGADPDPVAPSAD